MTKKSTKVKRRNRSIQFWFLLGRTVLLLMVYCDKFKNSTVNSKATTKQKGIAYQKKTKVET